MGRRGRVQLNPEDARKFDKNTFRTLKRLFSYLSPHKFLLLLSILFGIFGTAFDIMGPFIMGNTTNYVVENYQSGIDFSYFMRFIYILIGLYVLSYIAGYIRMRLGNTVKVSIVYEMREDVSQKLKKLPISFYDQNQTGDLLSRMTNDIQTIADGLTQVINQLFNSLVIIIGITGIMLYISPMLTLITILVIPLTILASFKIVQESQKLYSVQWKDLGELNSHIEEMYSSNKLVKSYNYEDESLEQFNLKNERLRASASKSEFLSGITVPISMFINNIGVVGVAVVGAYFVLTGRINIGNFQSFAQYSKRFTRPIISMTDILSVLQSGIAAAERVFEILDADEESLEKVGESKISDLKPSVEFENVSFGYTDEMVIKNLDLNIKEGSNVAIVGPTGSGKTTLVNLLMRFYDVDEGSIKIGGVDIRDFSRSSLRNYLSMVLQDSWLFEGTVAENISYGNEDATMEEIIQASKNSYAQDFILKLPNEYDTILEENASNISEGQKQLLTIARALIANPKILILDEATSSIDTRTERLIQKAMDNLVEGRTSFIIAHRLSTIINADIILVLKDGEIIEKGSHKELINQDGFYKELYYSQF